MVICWNVTAIKECHYPHVMNVVISNNRIKSWLVFKVGVATFLNIYIAAMVIINKNYQYFTFKLNHRLVRKIIKKIWNEIKNNEHSDLRYLYRYLKHIWKHPNYERFSISGNTYISKRLRDRRIHISTGNICTNDISPSQKHKVLEKKDMDINVFLDYLIKCFWKQLPF